MIVALDLATKTGWATYDGDEIKSGVENFALDKRIEGAGMRFLRFQRWLEDNHETVEEIVFEEVRNHSAVAAAHIYGGLLAILLTFCEDREIAYQSYPVGTIKKFATGNGNAKKDMMIAAVRDWGFNPKDDNEADAIAILKLRLSEGKQK